MDPTEQPISIDTTTPVEQPVSIDTAAPGNPQPSPNTADVRSSKVQYGLGELLGKSKAEIYAGLARGDEQSLRVQAASKLDALNNQGRVDAIIGAVRKNGGTLTMDQMDEFHKDPTDPNSVFEDNYVKKFLDGIYAAGANIGDTALDSVSINAPDVLNKDMGKAQSAFGNIEYARTKLENIQDQYEHQEWVPWLADQAKNIVPLYSNVKLGVGFGLQGSNLEEQTRSLLRLPGPDFRAKYDEVYNHLSNDNPSLALQWANAVVGMSTTDVGLANLTTLIDYTAIPGLAKGTVNVLRNINTVRIAIKDGIKASATARPDPADVAEGFGDLSTAAQIRATDVVMAKAEGVTRPSTTSTNLNTLNDPILQAKRALPTNFILDKDEIAKGSPFSRELTNRILQQQDVASNRIIEVAGNVAKVQRIPLEEALDSVMLIVKEEVKNQHPGIKNAILDVGDPVYNPFGNNYNLPVRIGNWTGEQFSSREVAQRFAAEHGILEYNIAGREGATQYLPEAAIKRPWETKSRLGEVTYKDGELRVHDDVGAQIQLSHTPQLNHIPITVEPSGKVTFHPTIKSEGDLTKAVTAQQGLGFHLLTWKPLDETQHVLKELTLSLESTKSSASRGGVGAWFNSIFGYGRSSDNTLSPFEIHQRKTAVNSATVYQGLLEHEMKYVEDVARGRVRVDEITGQEIGPIRSYAASLNPVQKKAAGRTFDEFKRTLAFATEDRHPDTGVQGYFKRSLGELNEHYLTNYQRPISFQEAQGYFAFVRNYENDRVFRSLREYTNKVRLGAEQHQFSFIDDKGNKLQSGFVDAVSRKALPGGEYPILDLTGDKPKVMLTSKLGSRASELAATIRKGEHVVSEVYNPELRQLNIPGAEGRYIRYVVTNSGSRETKALGWDQVNRLSGGHFAYDYEHSLKEARMMRDTYGSTTIDRYEGDTTFMALANRRQGENIAKVLNAVKDLLKRGDEAGAKEMFNKGLPGAQGPAMEWKEFLARTKSMKINGVMKPPSVNIHEPYYVVPKGKSIMDMDNSLEMRYTNAKTKASTFQDGTKSGSLARQYQVAYTQERDSEGLMRLRDEGTKGNPIYKYEPTPFIDPIATMNRALNEIVNSTFMEDMKVAGMETWLREAEPALKKELADLARAAPFYVFKSADDRNAFKSGFDQTKVANLLSNRFKTQQFLGVPSRYDAFMHNTAQNVADWMYDKMGPKGLLVPTWMFTKLTSPLAKLRSLAYNAKMGLFALPQVLTQLQSFVTIGSLAPRSAVAGTWAATLHQMSRLSRDADFVNLLDKHASALDVPGFHSMKPGFFKEAMTEMDNRGWGNFNNRLSTDVAHSYIKHEFGAFLDLGQSFFKYSDQHVKYASWYTAALEYQVEHPKIKVMSRTDWDKVLDRADDLSGNMTRASSSILQSGPLQNTSQFLTYQMHMAELFWGKRIGGETGSNAAARTRMYLAYSALFGMPMGVGISGLPLADYFRKAAIDHGYVVGDSWIQSAVMEGLPAVFAAWATSPTNDIKDGNWYNFSKLGSGGFTQLNNLMTSDPKFWDFIGGASVSIMANTIKNASGFVRAMASKLPGSSEQDAFPLKLDDFVDIAKEITAVNQSWKGIVAVSTGKWLSKNEAYQGDVSKANAAFMAATGLDMTNAADEYNMGQMIKDQTDAQKYALNRFTREFRRGVMAADNNDWDGYNSYMTRSFAYLHALNYPEDKIASAIAIASKGYEDRINSIREEFYTKNVPAGKEDQRMDAYTRFLKTQDK